MHHYLEFEDEKSSKYWEISSAEKSFTVRYGKIGTNGQTQTKEFSTVEEAEKAAEKILKEKLNKGYIEKESTNTEQPGPARNSADKAIDQTKRLLDAIETFRKYPGLEGWQRLFTYGLDDTEIKTFRKGLDLLGKVFPQNNMKEIMKQLW